MELYKYDYLNKEDIDNIMKGKKLDKKNVREYDSSIEKYINLR